MLRPVTTNSIVFVLGCFFKFDNIFYRNGSQTPDLYSVAGARYPYLVPNIGNGIETEKSQSEVRPTMFARCGIWRLPSGYIPP